MTDDATPRVGERGEKCKWCGYNSTADWYHAECAMLMLRGNVNPYCQIIDELRADIETLTDYIEIVERQAKRRMPTKRDREASKLIRDSANLIRARMSDEDKATLIEALS